MDYKIIFLKPIYHTEKWGSIKSKTLGYDSNYKCISRVDLVSATELESNLVLNTKENITLYDLFKNNKSLFKGLKLDEFPFKISLIDTNFPLPSIVYPKINKTRLNYSQYENEKCWYVLDAENDSKIVIGHKPNNKNDFKKNYLLNDFRSLLKYRKVKRGDFLFINPNTIHGLKQGMFVLEISTIKNNGYILNDSNVEEGFENFLTFDLELLKNLVKFPYTQNEQIPIINQYNNSIVKKLYRSKGFNVFSINLQDDLIIENKKFLIINILQGKGKVNGIEIQKGSNFIVTSLLKEITLSGKMELIITHL